jgi:hypothetical protein
MSVHADEDTLEYVATEEYDEDTEDYVKENTLVDYENQKVVNIASSRHVPAIQKLGGVARGIKRSTSVMYANQDVNVGDVPPAHLDLNRNKQGCASSEEIAPGTPPGDRVHTLPSDWPEGESLLVPVFPSSFTNCRPCI